MRHVLALTKHNKGSILARWQGGVASVFETIRKGLEQHAGKATAMLSLSALCIGGSREVLAQSEPGPRVGETVTLRQGAIGTRDDHTTHDMEGRSAGADRFPGQWERPQTVCRVDVSNRCQLLSVRIITLPTFEEVSQYQELEAKVCVWSSVSNALASDNGDVLNRTFPPGQLPVAQGWDTTDKVAFDPPWDTYLHEFRLDDGTNRVVLNPGSYVFQVGYHRLNPDAPLVEIMMSKTHLSTADGRLGTTNIVNLPGDGSFAFEADVRIMAALEPPRLSINTMPDGKVLVSWPGSCAPCHLEQSANFGAWQTVTNAVEVRDGKNCVELPADAARFFRLVE
jgi:hypothetical protein